MKSSSPRIVILGAGPTGLGAAWRLHELGYTNWQLLEASDQAGGLAMSVVDPAGFTWDLGGHVVFSHYQYFDDLLDSLLSEWVEHVRESWVWMRQRFIPYPLQHNIWRLPPEDLCKCFDGFLEVFKAAAINGNAKPAHFRDWILKSFGQGLGEVFLYPYNFKVWAYDPARLGVGWMGERVPTADLRRSLHNLIHQRDDVSWGPNARFRFPLHGGTGAIWRALANRLPASKVRLNSRVTRIDSAAKRLHLADGSTHEYDWLISTIPLDDALRAISDRPELTAQAGKLVYSSTHVVGIGIDAPAVPSLKTKCWMYFPEPELPFYRVTAFSNYSPNNVPIPGKQSSLMAEIAESPAKPVDLSRVVEETERGLRDAGLIAPDAPIISRWHRRLEHGYPTPFLERDSVINPVDRELKAMNILSRGRFGAWKYEVSNQDHSTMQGVEAADFILSGSQEVTYYDPETVNQKEKRPLPPRPKVLI